MHVVMEFLQSNSDQCELDQSYLEEIRPECVQRATPQAFLLLLLFYSSSFSVKSATDQFGEMQVARISFEPSMSKRSARK